MKRLDLAGKRFGRLTAIEYTYSIEGRPFWMCKCDCGKYKDIRTADLRSGAIRSCGCLYLSKKSHGMSHTRFYKILVDIKKRCYNENHDTYKHYGKRGIKCKWENFEEFRDDMYESYLKHIEEFGEKDTTIDRIDVNGNYCKENCKRATRKEQGNNRRYNVFVEYKGDRLSLSEMSRKLGLHFNIVGVKYRKLSTEEFNIWLEEKHKNI